MQKPKNVQKCTITRLGGHVVSDIDTYVRSPRLSKIHNK